MATCIKIWLVLLSGICWVVPVRAQETPEFPKGFVMHLRMTQGMQTRFHSGTDGFVLGFNLSPMWTAVQGKLRVGVQGGGFYANQKLGLLAGPALHYHLKTFNAGVFGSAANLHLGFNQCWGSQNIAMAGGGVYFEALNKVILGITAQRDYQNQVWWLQTSVGFRTSKLRKISEPFNE